ncbi:MAG: hypothetical protein ACK559_08835, partial [bacterium]
RAPCCSCYAVSQMVFLGLLDTYLTLQLHQKRVLAVCAEVGVPSRVTWTSAAREVYSCLVGLRLCPLQVCSCWVGKRLAQ